MSSNNMDLIIAVIGIGLIAYFNILAIRKHDWKMEYSLRALVDTLTVYLNSLEEKNKQEHKKTRKEIQEMKTRLTQVRKDLNNNEKWMKMHLKSGQAQFTIRPKKKK